MANVTHASAATIVKKGNHIQTTILLKMNEVGDNKVNLVWLETQDNYL